MRQFSNLAWDSYEQVYSLALQYTSVVARAHSVELSDARLNDWYEAWYRASDWSKEPHGLIIRYRKYQIHIACNDDETNFRQAS